MNNLKRRLQTGEPGTSNEPPPGRPSSRGIPVWTNGPPSGGDAGGAGGGVGWGEEGNGIGGPRPNDSSFSPPVISRILYGPIVGGSLSVISSAMIIFVILRSRTRLSSIYHRIMIAMSIADIIGSLALALTTLPMPATMTGYNGAEMPFVEFLPRVGSKALAFGNTQSCNAQGFCTTFGIATMFGYNVMLCVYYAFALAGK